MKLQPILHFAITVAQNQQSRNGSKGIYMLRGCIKSTKMRIIRIWTRIRSVHGLC